MSETFEQVLTAAQAEGSLTAAWKKFVNTKFFVPVVGSAGNDPKKFTLHLARGAQDGAPAVRISEVRERLEQAPGASLATLSGAEVVRMLHAEAEILVALSDRAFTIARDRVDWLKKGIEASQARAAAKALAAAAPVPVPLPTLMAAPVSIAKPAPQAVVQPSIQANAAPAPAGLELAPLRRNYGGVLDVAALKPRAVSLPYVGLEFFVPAAWQEIQNHKGMKFIDADSGTVVDASGFHRPNVSLMQWQGMRMALIQHEMRYLTQDGEPYAIDGDGWRDRVKGMATEFTGTFPGDDFPSRYLVACIRIDGTVASIAIRAPAADFEQNRPLYKWLLGRVDLLETAAIEARIPAGKQAHEFDHDAPETPPIFGISLNGRISRLQALAYSFPVFLPAAAAGVLAAVVMPKNQAGGLAILISALVLVLWLALRLLVLRLHDTNISGKWILYYLGMALAAGIFKMTLLGSVIMLVGWLAMMVFYCLVPGTPDDNDFGPPPGENSNWVKLGAGLFIMLQVAAVAGPAKMMKSPGGFNNSMTFDGAAEGGGGASEAQQEARTFMPYDRSFMVDIPGYMSEIQTPHQIQEQLGGAISHMYQANANHAVYMAQTIDFGRGSVDQVGIMGAIEKNVVGDGVLIEAKTILVSGMKGRDVRVSLPKGMIRAARFVVVGSKIVVVSVIAGQGPAGEAAIDACLISLRLP